MSETAAPPTTATAVATAGASVAAPAAPQPSAATPTATTTAATKAASAAPEKTPKKEGKKPAKAREPINPMLVAVAITALVCVSWLVVDIITKGSGIGPIAVALVGFVLLMFLN